MKPYISHKLLSSLKNHLQSPIFTDWKGTKLLLISGLIALGANAQTIRVSTNKTDLVMQVSPKGRLYQTYFGNKLNNAAFCR